jgi:hypothetical protein
LRLLSSVRYLYKPYYVISKVETTTSTDEAVLETT